MAYRTVLVSLGIDPQAQSRLNTALALARRHQSRVIGCFANTWSDILFHDRKILAIDDARRAIDEYAKEAGPAFEVACKAAQVSGTFERKSKPTTKSNDLIAASLTADLCVVSRSEQAGLDEGDIFLTLAEAVVTAASCPVLVLPDNPPAALGRNILVAWKPRREAARALRDALPLLHAADNVIVTTISDAASEESVASLQAFLRAHGIRADVRRDQGSDGRAGEILLDQAARLGCDTLVMGAYGHSRFRELVLGGATRYVLERAPICVVMSH
jgi:nucleotide-binding universal stress UspA family protein